MKYIAWFTFFILLCFATLFAASSPVLWPPFVAAVFFAILSLIWVSVLTKRNNLNVRDNPGNYMEIFKDIMANTIMLEQRAFVNQDDLKLKIEKLQDQIEEFVSHREQMQIEFGMKRYGEIYASFSLGELYVNRAWSAIVDSNEAEAKSAISKARKMFAVIGS